MTSEISERSFEETIECALLQNGPEACKGERRAPVRDVAAGGYHKRSPEEYDHALCLIPRDAMDFVLATQPKEWDRFRQHYGPTASSEVFLKRVTGEIERRGALDVLRAGIKDAGCKFQLDRKSVV